MIIHKVYVDVNSYSFLGVLWLPGLVPGGLVYNDGGRLQGDNETIKNA